MLIFDLLYNKDVPRYDSRSQEYKPGIAINLFLTRDFKWALWNCNDDDDGRTDDMIDQVLRLLLLRPDHVDLLPRLALQHLDARAQ